MSYDAKTVRQMNKLLKIIGNNRCHVVSRSPGGTYCDHRDVDCDTCVKMAKKYIVHADESGCPIRAHLNDESAYLTALGKCVLGAMRSI